MRKPRLVVNDEVRAEIRREVREHLDREYGDVPVNVNAPATKPRRAPKQKPGRSKQDYSTPADFMEAVEKRFGRMQVDLAATAENAKAKRFVTPEEDSLSLRWQYAFAGKRCWLNPPFERIAPWAAKCLSDGLDPAFRLGRIFFLTPASIGANWFAEYVHQRALVIALRGRLSFDGKDPYPKDCMLSVFGAGVVPGFEVWDWRAS